LLQLVFTQADTLVLDPLEPRTQLVRTLPVVTDHRPRRSRPETPDDL